MRKKSARNRRLSFRAAPIFRVKRVFRAKRAGRGDGSVIGGIIGPR
jgi:hypothetical protein